MKKVICEPRNFCTLGGALLSASSINGLVPIVHSGSECCLRLFEGLSLYNGHQGMGFSGGTAVPNTNIHRHEQIFSGEKKIKELIKNSTSVMDGELYAVMNGCYTELIGEDTVAVAKNLAADGIPLISVETAGFKGDVVKGHELFVKSLIEQFVQESDVKIDKMVNLWCSIPYYNPFWSGDYLALTEMLEGIGLKVNMLFGPTTSIENWQKSSSASLNILISPWANLDNVKLMESKFNIPYLHFSLLPIGATESSNFLRTVSSYLNLDTDLTEEYIAKQEKIYNYYFSYSADLINALSIDRPKKYIIVADSLYALGVNNFLQKETPLTCDKIFIVDNAPKKYRVDLLNTFYVDEINSVKDALTRITTFNNFFILGSLWEEPFGKKPKNRFLNISTPISDNLVLNKSYVGYKGGLRLLEDLYK